MGKITRHAKARLQERIGAVNGSAEANVRNALRYGIGHKDTRGQLMYWLNKRYLSYETANNIKLYKGVVYLFAKETLMTVYPLPEYFLTNAEENFTPEGYCRYFYRKNGLFGISGEEMVQKIAGLADALTRICGWSFKAVEVAHQGDRIRIMYVSNRYEQVQREYGILISTINKCFGKETILKPVRDENTHEILTKVQWLRKQQGLPYTGFGFEKTDKGARKNRIHKAA